MVCLSCLMFVVCSFVVVFVCRSFVLRVFTCCQFSHVLINLSSRHSSLQNKTRGKRQDFTKQTNTTKRQATITTHEQATSIRQERHNNERARKQTYQQTSKRNEQLLLVFACLFGVVSCQLSFLSYLVLILYLLAGCESSHVLITRSSKHFSFNLRHERNDDRQAKQFEQLFIVSLVRLLLCLFACWFVVIFVVC